VEVATACGNIEKLLPLAGGQTASSNSSIEVAVSIRKQHRGVATTTAKENF